MQFVMGFLRELPTVLFIFLVIAALKVQVNAEGLLANGTQKLNNSKIEITTVVSTLKNQSTNLTEKTAKLSLNTTINSKVVLIPPAKIASQIVRKKNVHKS